MYVTTNFYMRDCGRICIWIYALFVFNFEYSEAIHGSQFSEVQLVISTSFSILVYLDIL